MGHEVRYTRIANYTRLTDRYLTIQVKKPTDTDKTSFGTIFALVEINSPWFPNSQIGQAIINTLTQEYYKFSEKEPLENFEMALKKVNVNLARFAQEGETNWLGNINAIFAIILDDELLFANTGKAEGFLIRKDKISRIVEGYTPDQNPHPLKTFTNIVSGKLTDKDKVIITSPVLLDYLSQKEIKDIIVNGSPFQACEEIAHFLKGEKARHVNAIIMELLPKEDIENIPLSKEEVVYLDQVNTIGVLSNSTKKYASKIAPTLENFKKDLGESWDKTKHFFATVIRPNTKKAWDKTKEVSKKGYDHLATKTAPQIKNTLKPISDKISKGIKESISKLPEKKPLFVKDKVKIEAVDEKPKEPYSVNYYEELEKKSKFKSFVYPIGRKIQKYFTSFIKWVKKSYAWAIKKENRSITYITIIVLLIAILVFNVIELRKKQNTKQTSANQTQSLAEAKSKLDEAKLAILYNTPDKAKTLLNDSIKKALAVLNSDPKLANDAKDIINKSNEEFDKLTNTKRFNSPTLTADFKEVSNIFLLQDKLTALNKVNNSLYYLEGSEVVSQLQTSDSIEGKYSSFGFDNANNQIFAETDQNKLYKISDLQSSPEKLELKSGDWEKSNTISFFNNSYYLLGSENGQIYKYTSVSSGIGSGIDYLDTGSIDIKNAISMTIDGSIFVLKSDGSVVKLAKGNLQDFSISDIPTPNDKITKPKKIWTTTDINSIYILDDNRIIELDKNGKYVKQYAFSTDLQNISDFIYDTKNNKIYILNDKKVYSNTL